MPATRHIVFDLSEVLILGVSGCEHRIAADLGIDAAKVHDAIYGAPWHALLRGETTEEAYLTGILERQGWSIDLDLLKRRFREGFPVTVPGTIEIARQLAQRFPLTLLSDHVREWVPEILELHPFITELFPRRIFSFDTGTLKREGRIFKMLLDELKLKPEECLFIDDHAKNIPVAAALGIDCIRFRDDEQLRGELTGRSLL